MSFDNHNCGSGQCRGPVVDKFMNKGFVDPCDDSCERDCQEEPCVRYGCPVSLYDQCVFYSGGELCRHGIEEGKNLNEVINALGRMLVQRDRQIEIYHEEVLNLKRVVNELVNSLKPGEGGSGDNEEEDLW